MTFTELKTKILKEILREYKANGDVGLEFIVKQVLDKAFDEFVKGII